MTLTQEEISELKSQLKSQISHLPPDKQKEAIAQIDAMSSQALETMLEQQRSSPGQKIFRMLVSGEIPSVKIGENSHAIALLSTKSISVGHTIIIPKEPVKSPPELPKDALSLAGEISKKILSNLKAKSVEEQVEVAFGEAVINLIPVYENPLSLKSPRKDRSLEELEKIKTSLEIIKIEKKVEVVKKEKSEKTKPVKMNRRLP
jgi:histidine triad (HIT) family protein